MLEKTKGTIKKQSRDTGSIGCTRHKTKQKGQSRNNPETQAALGKQDTEGRQRKTKKSQHRKSQMSYRDPTKKPGVNLGTQGFQSFL